MSMTGVHRLVRYQAYSRLKILPLFVFLFVIDLLLYRGLLLIWDSTGFTIDLSFLRAVIPAADHYFVFIADCGYPTAASFYSSLIALNVVLALPCDVALIHIVDKFFVLFRTIEKERLLALRRFTMSGILFTGLFLLILMSDSVLFSDCTEFGAMTINTAWFLATSTAWLSLLVGSIVRNVGSI